MHTILMSHWPKAWPLLTVLKSTVTLSEKRDKKVKETEGESERKKEKGFEPHIKPWQLNKPQIQTDFLSISDPISLSLCRPSLPSPQQSGCGDKSTNWFSSLSFWGLDQRLDSMHEGSTRLQTFPQTHTGDVQNGKHTRTAYLENKNTFILPLTGIYLIVHLV